ncbi:MAG: secretin and TonB N-terminal domain-containing protein [Nitrosomonas sp.]|uniref:STN domain-containing protein n=1 Tax=Nitrosomonas sp. TaxID=42353 RepID=UPI002B368771|nr:secretin and TonB N-terminal domain-containing protein [Nitrosomonas sp.]MEB2332364.1 secretin and TonB N-terminal domain-containing protein [Nitrosomonas sp.]
MITCILASLTGAVVIPNSVMAAEALDNTAQRDYAIPASQLGDALAQFAAASGVPLSFDPQMLSGLSSKGLQGRYTVRAGFSRLLAGSGYELVDTGSGYSLRRVTAGESGVVTLAPVTVTGTAISPSDLPPAYAGGQVARGGRVGLLGNRDVMDTPFSVTQYTSQLIEDQQAQNIGEVLDSVVMR